MKKLRNQYFLTKTTLTDYFDIEAIIELTGVL